MFEIFSILEALFRSESGLFRFLCKNSVKVEMVCAAIRRPRSRCDRGNYLNVGPCHRFTSHFNKRLVSGCKYFLSERMFAHSNEKGKASVFAMFPN